MGTFNFLVDGSFKPEKVADSYEPFKGTFDCIVNFCRIEEYSGDKEEFEGARFFRYELEVAKGQPNESRRLWKSVWLNEEKNVDRMKKLANQLFTLGLEFSSTEDLQDCCDKLAEMTITVRAWSFKPEDSEDRIQVHSIKGEAKQEGEKSPTAVPF